MVITRSNPGGNYCGHDPKSPSLILARRMSSNAPSILTELSQRLTDYYYSPRRKIPSLDLANHSQRQQRSERREACIQVLLALIKFLDLASLRVGKPTQTGFNIFPVRLLIKHTGLGYKRFSRALWDLKKAGLVNSKQPRYLTESGEYRGLAAIRTVSKDLFTLFGLSERLKYERKRATERLRKFATNIKKSLTAITRLRLVTGINPASNKRSQNMARLTHRHTDPPDDTQQEYDRQLGVLEMGLRRKYPDWDSKMIRSKACGLLYGQGWDKP